MDHRFGSGRWNLNVGRVSSFEIERISSRWSVRVGHLGWTERHGIRLRLPFNGGSAVGETCTALDGSESVEALAADVRRLVEHVAGRALPNWAGLGEALQGAPTVSARACLALELAVLDAQAQSERRAVAQILAGDACPIPPGEVGINGLLGEDIERWPGEARSSVASGTSVLKAKLSPTNWEERLRALRALRAELGPDVGIRLDLNGTLDPSEVATRFGELHAVGPELVEQPVPVSRTRDLASAGVPCFADESMADPEAAEAVLAAPSTTWAGVVLKPAILGMRRSRDLGVAALARGKDVVVTHAFDGPIAMSAAFELARSLPRPPLACGLAPHHGLSGFPPRVGSWSEVAVPWASG